MSQYIFELDGNYVNFNGGANIWRMHRNADCVSWFWGDNGDLFFDVWDHHYQVKSENISDVIINGTSLTEAADFATEIVKIFNHSAAGILSSTVTLTDAQIKALPTTAIEIIAAPGSGRAILPIWGTASLTGANYTNIAATSFCGCYYSVSFYRALNLLVESGTGGMSNFFAFGESIVTSFITPQSVNTGLNPDLVVPMPGEWPHSGIDNNAIIFYMSNPALGDLTGGDAANTLKVTVYYVIVDL